MCCICVRSPSLLKVSLGRHTSHLWPSCALSHAIVAWTVPLDALSMLFGNGDVPWSSSRCLHLLQVFTCLLDYSQEHRPHLHCVFSMRCAACDYRQEDSGNLDQVLHGLTLCRPHAEVSLCSCSTTDTSTHSSARALCGLEHARPHATLTAPSRAQST